MRKLFKRFLIAILLLFVLRVYGGGFEEGLTRAAQKTLKAYNVPCSVSGVRLVPIARVSVEDLSCQVQMFPVRLKSTVISFRFIDLFFLAPGIELSSQVYGGNVEIVFNRKIVSGESIVKVRAEDLHLEQAPTHSSVKVAGIGSAELRLSILDDIGSGGGVIGIQNLDVRANMQGSSLRLPGISNGDLSSQVRVKGRDFLFDKISLSALEGEMFGEARFTPFDRSYSADGKIQLQGNAVKSIGGYLALFARTDPAKPAEEWNISIAGNLLGQPKLVFSEIR